MLKIFATQLSGLFKKIEEKEEFSFEDGARLLAQAPIGDGSIYLLGVKEMKSVEWEALQGVEPLQSAKSLSAMALDKLSDADRVLIFTRDASDEEALAAARRLHDQNIPFVGVSADTRTGSAEDFATSGLAELADVHINLHLTKGLVPDEMGNRVGFPYSMAGLFVYYGLKFTIDEILSEYKLR